jgi:biopolymer transport protein ExbB/TolQ
MATSAHGTSRLVYPGTLAMLALAFLFPVGLMVFNPTLMFERGWEQYVGTAIYFWAVLTLVRELRWLWKNEQAFAEAPNLLKHVTTGAAGGQAQAQAGGALARKIDADERRILPARIRQLACTIDGNRAPSASQLMELNREGSGLDQEHAAGRFTLTRYILYLLPVIGFIGTVEGISKALMNISKVLPMVKNLDGFMNNLTGVTSALQIAFDSTLLALFLSAALMLVQTLVFRRSEDLLARIDRWVVEYVLPRFGSDSGAGGDLAQALGPEIDRFAAAIDRLGPALANFERGSEAIGRIGNDLEALGSAGESLRRGVACLGRIEVALSGTTAESEQLDAIKRAAERTTAAIEALANSWAQAYERSSRANQEQLARTMSSLKDALDMLNVSMEQSNALYRNIVKKMFDDRHGGHGRDTVKVA